MSYCLRVKYATVFLLSVAMLSASADKKLPIGEASNEALDITASPPLTRDEVKQELGADLGEDVIAIRVTARPVSDKPVQLTRDNFLMVSNKDGQRSQPFEPGELAGSDSLAVTTDGVRRGGLGNHGPSLSVGLGLGGIGTGGGAQTPNVKVRETRDSKENPLLAALKAKMLPEKKITEPVTGLLFFDINGKVKAKDLELRYKGPAGEMALRFKTEK